MKNIRLSYKRAQWIPLIALLLTLQSCFVAKQYERPQNSLSTVNLFRKEYQQVEFRKEYQQVDSTNIGLIKREKFFTDPILQLYIEIALQNNSEALIYNAQALLVQIDNQIEVTENTFNLLLAGQPKTVERGSLDEQQIVMDLSIGVPYQLLSNRPDVRAAEYDLIRTFQLVNVAKADFYPSFRLTASSGFQSIEIDQLFSPRALFGNVIASLTQPVWNRRQLKTRHEINLANQQISYLNYRKSILNAGKEVSDALSNFQSQTKIEELKIKEYSAYQEATKYSQELMNHGLANYLEVLRAQENELSTQINILDAKYNKLNSVVQLYKALGGGWE